MPRAYVEKWAYSAHNWSQNEIKGVYEVQAKDNETANI